jgi:hypothetical protein
MYEKKRKMHEAHAESITVVFTAVMFFFDECQNTKEKRQTNEFATSASGEILQQFAAAASIGRHDVEIENESLLRISPLKRRSPK